MKSQLKQISFVVALILLGTGPALAQRGRLADGWNERNGPQVLAAFKTVVADADKCTARIYCDGKETLLGTVVGADGWIATKYSELHDPIVCRLADGRQLPAKVVGFDSHYDLAMLKIEAKNLKSVDWSDDDKGPVVGQLVASAAPGELPKAIGVVSVPRRAIPGVRAQLGVRLGEADSTVLIASVDSNTPAAKAGLIAGDIVVRLDDTPIDDVKKMIDMIHNHEPGDAVDILVRRGEKEVKATATLVAPKALPPTRSDRMNGMGSILSKQKNGFAAVIQHDTVLQSSECGGPLVDLSGKVVGINIARAGRVESYAVPADQVQLMLADLESGKLAPKTILAGATDAKPPEKPEEKPAEAKAEK
jgi:serine protease Do